MALLRITWTKSYIGYRAGHREVVRSLGLRRLNHTVVHQDNPSIRGMVQKVAHLVTVEAVEEPESRSQPQSASGSSTRSRRRTSSQDDGKEAKATK